MNASPTSAAPSGASPSTAPPSAGGGSSRLSSFDIGCVVIGGIIGVGIFFSPSKVAQRTASATEVMVAWGIGGVLAVLGALVFAELAARVPGHGGIFRFIHAAFGRLPAFLYGWANWLVIQAGALGVVALLFVDHLERALFGATTTSPAVNVAFAMASILVFTATNLRGLRVGKVVQNLLTVTKVAAILGLAVIAFWVAGGGGTATEAAAGANGVAADSWWGRRITGALLPVLFAIGGWQQGSFVGGAARDPRRDVPRGILLGVAVVIGVYMAINVAYLHLLGFDGAAASSAIGADAARVALGGPGERVFAAMVAVSAAGIMNTICMAPPYVLLAMAEEGLFPRAFAVRHPRFDTPTLGVLGQGVWAAVLLLVAHVTATVSAGDSTPKTIDTLGFVCDGVVFVDWLFFMLCGLALLVLRRRGAPAAFVVPFGAAVAVAFAACAALVTLSAILDYRGPSLTGAGLVALGLPAYAIFRRRAAVGETR